MSSPLFLQLFRTLSRVFNRVSDGLILELDAANTSSYTGANGSVTDGSTFEDLSETVNSDYTFRNNTGNLKAYIVNTPKYIEAKPYDTGYLVSGNGAFNKNYAEYIEQSVLTDASVLTMNAAFGTGFNVVSRTVEWWGRVTARPGSSTYVAPGGLSVYNGRSILFGGDVSSSGVLTLIDNEDDTCNLVWTWDDSAGLSAGQEAYHATETISMNTWTQVALVLQPSNTGTASEYRCTYYINGEDAGNIVSTDALSVNQKQFWLIGRSNRAFANNNLTAANSYFSLLTQCDTSIFRQYNRALTAAEIRQNYNAERTKFRLINYDPVISNPPPVETATYTILAGTSDTFSVRRESDSTTVFTGTAWSASDVNAGDIVEFESGTHGPRDLRDLYGTAANPIIIRSSTSGKAIIRRQTYAQAGFIFQGRNWHHVTVDGSNTTGETYGIKVTYASSGTDSPTAYINISSGATAQSELNPTDNVTIKNVEVDGGWSVDDPESPYAPEGAEIGIQINDSAYFLGRSSFPGYYHNGFTIESCYVHNTKTEGMYIGPNYASDRIPFSNVVVANCIVSNTGWDAINLKSMWNGNNRVYGCTITNAGIGVGSAGQHSGIDISSGSCDIYNNFIKYTGEAGIRNYTNNGPLTTTDGVSQLYCNVYNNIVYGGGANNIVDWQTPQGINMSSGDVVNMTPLLAKVFNNTVVDAGEDGIYGGSRLSSGSFAKNNIIANYNPSWKQPSYVDATNSSGPMVLNNNITDESSIQFIDRVNYDFRLAAAVAASGTIGVDISATDYAGTTRETGSPDAGAYEYIN